MGQIKECYLVGSSDHVTAETLLRSRTRPEAISEEDGRPFLKHSKGCSVFCLERLVQYPSQHSYLLPTPQAPHWLDYLVQVTGKLTEQPELVVEPCFSLLCLQN